MFGCKPSDVALLDECVDEIGRFYFDRGIWMFGRHVANRLDQAAQSKNPAIARTQRLREWERLMGVDMTSSTTGFADPGEAMTPHGRIAGNPQGDDDIVLDG